MALTSSGKIPTVFDNEPSARKFLLNQNRLLAKNCPKIARKYDYILSHQPIVKVYRTPISDKLKELFDRRKKARRCNIDKLESVKICKPNLTDNDKHADGLSKQDKNLVTSDHSATPEENKFDLNLILPFDDPLGEQIQGTLDELLSNPEFMNDLFGDSLAADQNDYQKNTSDTYFTNSLPLTPEPSCQPSPSSQTSSPPKTITQQLKMEEEAYNGDNLLMQFVSSPVKSSRQQIIVQYKLIPQEAYGIIKERIYKRPHSYVTNFKDLTSKKDPPIPLEPIFGLNYADPRQEFLLSKTHKAPDLYDRISRFAAQVPVSSPCELSDKFVSPSFKTNIPATPSTFPSPASSCSSSSSRQFACPTVSPPRQRPATAMPRNFETNIDADISKRIIGKNRTEQPITMSTKIMVGQRGRGVVDNVSRSMDRKQLFDIISNIEINSQDEREGIPLTRDDLVKREKIDTMLLNTHITIQEIMENRHELKRIVRSTNNSSR